MIHWTKVHTNRYVQSESEIEIDWYVAKMSIPEKLEVHRKEIIKMVGSYWSYKLGFGWCI